MTDIKHLLTDFERFAYGQSLSSAFNELLDWTLLPFKKFNTHEEQLTAFNSFREHPKVAQLTSLITLIGELRGLFRPDWRTISAGDFKRAQRPILDT